MGHGMGHGETIPSATQRGIFDCDDAYRTPTSGDYRRLFEAATVVLDTNVLLNLYRSNERTRTDTFAVLKQLQERLWIPHQVLSEFWKNRDLPSVRGHHRAKARTACSALDKALRSLNDGIERWLKDVLLDTDDAAKGKINGHRDRIHRSLEEMKRFIEAQAENDALEGTGATHTDPVLMQLEPLLLGRIGEPMSSDEHVEAVAEAKARADTSTPPGYEDFSSKPDEQAAGDYIIWKQIIVKASAAGRDVLLVTGDVKEDWWTLRTGSTPARPRPELRNELRKEAGVELYMMTPSQLLAEASGAFELKVDERSVNDLASREGIEAVIFPPILKEAILTSFEAAHTRALAAHEATGLKARSPYSVVMDQVLNEELTSNILSAGGEALDVNGRTYALFEGLLLVPLRAGTRLASTRIMSSRRVQALAEFLNPAQEELDFGTIRRDQMLPIIVTYTSSPENGVGSAEANTGKFIEDGRFRILHRAQLR
ncbi:PIN-like domain-containing protein [Streptomyces tendae]|uniref:PIN-like domain-containing protein n=1 Tax=Streptomyces tendae TaxID=1932 RepID=UPI003694C3E0